jgi:glycosyltransferase involved in cell wall biosynthesis
MTIWHYDAIVVHRGIFPFPWPMLERIVIRKSKSTIFDFDDAIHVGHRDLSNTAYSWIYRLKYGPAVNILITKCNYVIAGNQNLAVHARQFNSNVTIIPTVVDLDRYTYASPTEKRPITIGWVGSRSTSPYLLEIEPALRRISETHGANIQFRFYGDPSQKLDLPNCECIPFSLSSEIEHLRRIDIGIMPLPDNEWTRGKCAFKAIQYMALGIPTVSSPVGVACEVVEHRRNGLCASTNHEWFECLDLLIRSSNLRVQFAETARRTVQDHFSLQTWAPRICQLFRDIVQSSSALGPECSLGTGN